MNPEAQNPEAQAADSAVALPVADQIRRTRQKSPALLFGLYVWEVVVLALCFMLLAGIAIPNYFKALEAMRGTECSSRLTLVGNCLKYLADRNGTKPGEKICELFDLNETLELAQGGSLINIGSSVPFYYRVGAEPDCPGTGNHGISLYLAADGQIVAPTCTRAFEPKLGAYFKERGLHFCNLSKVTGDIYAKSEAMKQ